MISSETDNTSNSQPLLPSEAVIAELPTADEWAAKIAKLDDIAEELSLPKFGDFMDEDITPEMITEATREQVEAVETRIAVTRTGRVGAIVRWENREKQPLPLWFHLPHGRQVIRRLMMCGRFTVPEIAQMLGLRNAQLSDFLKGMGLEQDMIRLETARQLRKYREAMAEYATHGRMKATAAAFQQMEKFLVDPDDPTKTVPKVNVKDLKMLNEIFVMNDPAEKEDKTRPGGIATSVSIGVRVTSVDRKHKPNQPPTYEAELTEEPPQE